MSNPCPKCGGDMETGAATFSPMLAGSMIPKTEPHLLFVIAGTPTSINPVTAFKQGLTEETPDRGFWIRGVRCSQCGYLELYAKDATIV